MIMSNMLTDSYDNDLFINENELNNELLDQSLRYMKYAKLKAKANKNVKVIKRKLDEIAGSVRSIVREENPSLRVADVDGKVNQNEEVKQVKIELEEAEYIAELLQDATYAFRQRSEMLKDLSANRRKEVID